MDDGFILVITKFFPPEVFAFSVQRGFLVCGVLVAMMLFRDYAIRPPGSHAYNLDIIKRYTKLADDLAPSVALKEGQALDAQDRVEALLKEIERIARSPGSPSSIKAPSPQQTSAPPIGVSFSPASSPDNLPPSVTVNIQPPPLSMPPLPPLPSLPPLPTLPTA